MHQQEETLNDIFKSPPWWWCWSASSGCSWWRAGKTRSAVCWLADGQTKLILTWFSVAHSSSQLYYIIILPSIHSVVQEWSVCLLRCWLLRTFIQGSSPQGGDYYSSNSSSGCCLASVAGGQAQDARPQRLKSQLTYNNQRDTKSSSHTPHWTGTSCLH